MAFDLVAVNADYVARVSASLGADVLQPHGNSHGMVLSAVADSASGDAAQTVLGRAFDVVTMELKGNYLTPACGPRVGALGRVMRAGRTLHVCSGDVYSCGDGPDKLVAHRVATMMVVLT